METAPVSHLDGVSALGSHLIVQALNPGLAAATTAGLHEASRDEATLLPKLDLQRSLAPLEQPFSLEQPMPRVHTELLPPARLVEVAHAALQSSGFRPRQFPGTTHQGGADRQTGVAADTARSGSLKRELPLQRGDGRGDEDGLQDQKRPRTASGGSLQMDPPTAQPPCTGGPADAVAHITPSGLFGSSAQQALQPANLTSLPPTAPISPFARPFANRLSVSAALSGESGPSVANGGLKSAFSNAGSLPGEWQPGCSITTGRRSARSPALKGNRALSLVRAASTEANKSPTSRRGSAAASLLAQVDAQGANGAAPSAVEAAGNVAGAAGDATAGGNGGPEATTSADLRRLAQLAEAAAMLEKLVTGGVAPKPAGDVPGPSSGVGNGAGQVPANGQGGTTGEGAAAPLVVPPLIGLESVEQAAPARQLAGALQGAGLAVASSSGSGDCGSSGSALGLPARDLPRPQLLPMSSLPGAAASVRPAAPAQLRMADSQPLPGAASSRGGPMLRDGLSDTAGEDGGGSLDGGDDDDYDDDMGDEMGDGSNDSGGGGSSAGAGIGGKSLTERYRAALKASAAQQRGRALSGGGSSRSDADKPSRAMRNGVCARIASITKERLQQVYHLNIEEAARELGIGMTKLKEHCRTLGIPRWPSRKLKSMDKLIESLNERAMTEPATKEVIADILAEIESFKRAIYENPCLEVEEDIKRLRQSNFKKEYQQRQVEQRMRLGSSDRSSGRAASPGAAPFPQLHGSGLDLLGAGGGIPGGMLGHPGLAGGLPGLGAGFGAGLLPGQLSAGASLAGPLGSLSQVQGQQLPGQMPMLAPGLQQLLMGQNSQQLQQFMTQRALGNVPPSGLLLPSVLSQQINQTALQAPEPLAAGGEAIQDDA